MSKRSFEKLLWHFVFLSVPLLSLRLYAESQSPILVVDINRVFEESIAGKAAVANLDQEKKKRALVVQKIEQDLKKLDQAIQKQASILSPSAINEKREQFEKKRVEFVRAAQDAQAELLKYQQSEFGKVFKQVDEILARFAEKRKGKFVLDYDKRMVLFAKKSIDLTEELVEELNESALKS